MWAAFGWGLLAASSLVIGAVEGTPLHRLMSARWVPSGEAADFGIQLQTASDLRSAATGAEMTPPAAVEPAGQGQGPAVPEQLPARHLDVVVVAGNDRAPSDPAVVQDAQRVLIHATS